MQNELRRGITLIRVDVLGGSDEANAERDDLLNTANAMRYAPSPAVEFPDQHGVKAPQPSVLHKPVQLRPAGFGASSTMASLSWAEHADLNLAGWKGRSDQE